MVESLTCQATKCIYNNQNQCNATAINVGGDMTQHGSETFCGTYVDKENMLEPEAYDFDNKVSSKSDMETAEGLTDFHGAPAVGCNALKCEHNHDYKCHASSVKILDENDGRAECETFKPE